MVSQFSFCRLTVGVVWLSLASAAAAGDVHVGDARCVVDSPAWESQRIHCRLPAQPQAQRWRLEVRFQGSHDDTILGLAARVNQKAMQCDEGSKTESRFEDGEVTLRCGFTVEAGTDVDFEALLRVSHADFDGFTLKPQ